MTLTRAYLLIFGSFVWLILCGVSLGLLGAAVEPFVDPLFLGMLVLGVFVLLYMAGAAVWAGAKGHHPLWGIGVNLAGPIAVGLIAMRFDFNISVWSPLLMPIPGLLMLLLLSDNSPARRAIAEQQADTAVNWELKNLAKRVALLEQLRRSPAEAAAARQRIELTGNSVAQYHARTLTLLKEQRDAAANPEMKQAVEATLEQVRNLPTAAS